MNLYQNQLYVSVQDQPAFTVTTLYKNFMQACGGKITSAYLSLGETEITEALFHLYTYIGIKTEEKNKDSESKLQGWGFSEDDFE